METRGFKPNARRLGWARTLVTVLALAILVAGVLVVWLIDDRDVGLILALGAILVGWLVALILAQPHGDPPVCQTQATEGSGSRRCPKTSNWEPTPPNAM
jgi:membrane associated rhomboid family serine protease